MTRRNKLVLIGAFSSAVLAWPVWTIGIPFIIKFIPFAECLHPLIADDGVDVGYHFFVLRQLLLFLAILTIAVSLWACVRSTKEREQPAGGRLKVVAVLLAGQFLGFTLLAFFPESHLSNLLEYGYFAHNNKTKGFSIKKFFSIREELTSRDEVVRLLGKGRKGSTLSGSENSLWMYSGDWSETGWRFWIRFDDEGNVKTRQAYFWRD